MHQSRVLRTLDWQIAARFASALCIALGPRVSPVVKLPQPASRARSKKYKQYWLPIFEKSAKEPILWSMKGDALVDAAKILRPHIDEFLSSVSASKVGVVAPRGACQSPTYVMLLAFAAENFLKGILIGREPQRVLPSSIKKWEKGGHDLRELAKLAKIKLRREETKLLLNLSVHCLWLGRYPCSLNLEDHLPRPTKGGGFSPLGGILDSDLDLALQLCEKFKRILQKERSKTLPNKPLNARPRVKHAAH